MFGKNTDPDHIYVDATFYNNSFEDTNSPQYVPARILQMRDQPFLNNPQDYNMTIVRFSISSDMIGRIHQDVTTTTSNTKLWVSLSYNSIYYDEPIVIPTTTSPIGQFEKTSYNIFNFLDLINAGYLAAQSAVGTAGGPTGAGQVLMNYNPQSQLYSMNIPAWYGTGGTGGVGNGIGVHMSYFLWQDFQSFNVIQNSPLLYNNHDITFVREWLGNNLVNNIYTNVGTGGTGTTGVYMSLTQDAAWPSVITDVCRLVILTSTLPVVSEFKATMNYLSGQGSQNNQSLLIITDFLIGQDSELQSRGESWRYIANPYRLSQMLGSTPLRQFDIICYVADKQGNLSPLYLSPGGSIDVKLLFLKKGLSN